MHDGDTSWLEAVFARGDRSLAAVLERAYSAGARFDSWEDQKRMALWEDAFRTEGVDPAKYLGTIPVTARLPWDHIDVGLEEGFLAARVPEGAQEPALVAVRQGRRRVRPRDEPRRRQRRLAQTRLLRLRRRVRPLGDARAAPRLPSQARRRRAPKAGPRADCHAARRRQAPAGPHVARRPSPLPLRLREARRSGVPLAPRRRPRPAARVPAPRAAALLLAGLPPEAGHDVRSGPVARRGEPLRGRWT